MTARTTLACTDEIDTDTIRRVCDGIVWLGHKPRSNAELDTALATVAGHIGLLQHEVAARFPQMSSETLRTAVHVMVRARRALLKAPLVPAEDRLSYLWDAACLCRSLLVLCDDAMLATSASYRGQA